MNSQYDVVIKNGGKPGRDFEISWGAKYISYLFCMWTRRILPFGIYSPRIALAFVHGAITIFVFLLCLRISDSYLSSIIAAVVYVITSSLIHTATYVCSPENFDVSVLPVLAYLVIEPSLPGAVLAGIIVALMIALSKMVDLVYAIPIFFLYQLSEFGHLAWVFLGSLSMVLAVTMVIYRYSDFYHPFSEIFSNAYRYATRTIDRSSKKLFHFNFQALIGLWNAILKEIPVIIVALILSPFILNDSASSRIIFVLSWSAMAIMIVQNKLWAVHIFPALSLSSVLVGLIANKPFFLAPVLFLTGVSIYYFLSPMFVPKGKLSRYFWELGSGSLHYLDDEANLKAAEWIKKNAPGTKSVLCWGMQNQLYTHLEIMGPTPIQHFSKESLTMKKRQEQLLKWFYQTPPGFVFFCDPYFRYYPLCILEGLAAKEYELIGIFGEGNFPLYGKSHNDPPEWKRRVAQKIGFDFKWDDFADVFFRENPPNLDSFDETLKEMKATGIDSVYIYGKGDDQYLLSEFENRKIDILGSVQTSAPKGNGIIRAAELSWPLKSETGLLITAKGFNSISQIRRTIEHYQPDAKVYSIINETPISDWLLEESTKHGLVIYGLGASGRYVLDISRRKNIKNVAYYDRSDGVNTHSLVSLKDLIKGNERILLGAAPSTNIEIYFSLLSKGIPDSRINDFSGIFGRSCLPGRLDEDTLISSYENQYRDF